MNLTSPWEMIGKAEGRQSIILSSSINYSKDQANTASNPTHDGFIIGSNPCIAQSIDASGKRLKPRDEGSHIFEHGGDGIEFPPT